MLRTFLTQSIVNRDVMRRQHVGDEREKMKDAHSLNSGPDSRDV